MSYLSTYTTGKDNNFNLIRIISALAVLITHSFALSTGNPADEPFRATIGMTMGSIAVDIFFITSGFLVTSSLLRNKSVLDFLISRFLRIYPALFITVVLSVFILGAYLTNLTLEEYFTAKPTYKYAFKTSTLLAGVEFNLPGVFHSNPFPDAVNGSLWTMPYEVRMYFLLILVWLVSSTSKIRNFLSFKSILLLVAITFSTLLFFQVLFSLEKSPFIRLTYMFFTGATIFVLREKIRLKTSYFIFCSLLILGSILIDKSFFTLIYYSTIAYLLFYLAYVPSGKIRKYNRLGDYSYGVYIFAFPLQQLILAKLPGTTPLQLVLYSTLATLLFAVLSWHLIEKRALALKPYIHSLFSGYKH